MLAALGCHAQAPASASGTGSGTGAGNSSGKLSPELARRIEVLIRTRSSVPPEYVIDLGPRTRSEMPGYDQILVSFSAQGKTSKPIAFLLSSDGKTLAQFSKFDLSKDPKELVSAAGRPARGGPANAPVLIVGFDDLECPYCAKMHEEIFPALMDRYKDQIHIVYRDFPLDIHPWAMRAAVDTNCVGAQNAIGYWNLVDYIHAHASEVGGAEKSVAKANQMLDTMARDEGTRQKLNAAELNACLAKQDQTAIKESIQLGDSLHLDATPTLFINGEKIEGAQPIEDVYRMIDEALVASGQTPPPPPAQAAPATAPLAAPKATPQTAPASKPGR